MGLRIGLIPAAGKGVRFGGAYKELLPISRSMTLLDSTVDAMKQGKAQPLVISSSEKIATHAIMRPELTYTLQTAGMDIWGAMLAGITRTDADEYLFGMPDTLYNENAFDREMVYPFMIGTFETDMPERYGMIREGQVVNKQQGEPGIAWGVLMWTRDCADLWRRNAYMIETYTEAINLALTAYGLYTFRLDYYIDISCFDDYQRTIG